MLTSGEIGTTFKENNYQLKEDSDQLSISRKRNIGYLIAYLFISVLAIPFAFVSGYKVVMLVIWLVAVPIIYRTWMLPRSITITKHDKSLRIFKNIFQQKTLPNSMLKEISVKESVIATDVSPFKEGYQDFVYTFKVNDADGKVHDLFSLKYRKPMEEQVQAIFNGLNKELAIS